MTTLADQHHDEVPAWVLTALVSAGQAIAIALIVAIGSHDDGSHAYYGAYAFAAGFGALLLLRHKFPVAVLMVAVLGVFIYYAADYPPIGMAVPVVGAFYGAAEKGRVVTAAGAGVVLLAVSLYFRMQGGETSTVLAYDIITNVALIGCAISLALAVRSRRAQRNQHRHLVALERKHQQDRASRQIQAARLQLARDIHDSVGHALTLVSVQARVAQEALGHDDTTVAQALHNVVSATATSLADLRSTLATLQADPGTTGHAPLTLSGIKRTAQAARDAGLNVEVLIDVGDDTIPAPTASTALRIVQESVTNVLRHAQAEEVKVIVRAKDDDLYLRIADDGRGAGPQSSVEERRIEGTGITGMRERAALIGGAITVEGGPSGFTVNAVLPIGEGR